MRQLDPIFANFFYLISLPQMHKVTWEKTEELKNGWLEWSTAIGTSEILARLKYVK